MTKITLLLFNIYWFLMKKILYIYNYFFIIILTPIKNKYISNNEHVLYDNLFIKY